MEPDLLHDWDDTPADEKEAIEILDSYHHLLYQMMNDDFKQNLMIVKQYCSVPFYHEDRIMSAATAKESNKKLLKFLEEKYSLSCDYNEFFVILRKLMEMPQALSIVDSMEKKIDVCFKERRAREKLNRENGGTTTTAGVTTSSVAVSTAEEKTILELNSQQPTEDVQDAAGDSSASTQPDDGTQVLSAKTVITKIVTEVLYSTPGYHILESYKDRICECLPPDYSNTAIRLQSLIGASDHMVQWALTGDTSKANHRIYQIVLVHECFQPHFIKFCDIMEVLAAGSLTVGYVVELRKSLINNLYSDGHITAEEASHLSSKKLFKPQTPPATNIPVAPVFHLNNTVANGSAVNTSSVPVTSSTNLGNISTAFSLIHSGVLASSVTRISTAGVGVSTTGQSSHVPVSLQSASLQSFSARLQTSAPVADSQQPSITVTPGTPLVTPSSAFTNVSKPEATNGDVQSSSPEPTKQKATVVKATEKETLNISDDLSQPTSSVGSVEDDASSHDENYYYDGLIDDPTPDASEPTSSTTKPIGTEKLNTAAPRGTVQSALKLDSTASGDANSVTVVLEQARSVVDSDQSANSLINFIIDNDVFSYNGIVHFLLSSQQERSVLLMQALEIVKVKSAVIGAGVKAVSGPKLTNPLSGVEDVQDILNSREFAVIKTKYTEILACFPENFEATVGCLQNYLSDSDITEILFLTSGQNQKILNCLIRKLRRIEDLLDFCESLEKIDGAPSLLVLIVEQIRKEVIDQLQAMTSPVKPVPEPVEYFQEVPISGPLEYIPELPIPVMPESPEFVDPFQSCSLPADSEGLAAMRKCYPELIKNLSSNHTTTMSRLQSVATVPEDKKDSFMKAPNSDIGNEMIVSYLIGLVHTEDDILTFCNYVEKMIDVPAKCECVVALRNAVTDQQQLKKKLSSIEDADTESITLSATETVPDGGTVPTKTADTGDVHGVKTSTKANSATAHAETVDTDDAVKTSELSAKKAHAEKMASFQSERLDESTSSTAGTISEKVSQLEETAHHTEATPPTVQYSKQSGPELSADTQAALSAFNEYWPQLQSLDPVMFGAVLISHGVLESIGGVHSGEAMLLPNEVKMNFDLPNIYKNIYLNGPKVFFSLTKALSEMPSGFHLSTQLKDAYQRYRQPSGIAGMPQSKPPSWNAPSQAVNNQVHATISATSSAAFPRKEQRSKDTDAALEAFDEYYSVIRSIDASMFIPRCIGRRVLSGDVSARVGGSVFLTDENKMDMNLPYVRNAISLNGIDKFEDVLYILRSEPTGIYVELANNIERTYQIYKDPVAGQKRKKQLEDEQKKTPATETDPKHTKAALDTFYEYYDIIHDHVQVEMFTEKCVGYGVLPETSPISGASIFQPDYVKMDIVLPLIRNNIALNGVRVFQKLVKVFESMGDYGPIAVHLKAAYENSCAASTEELQHSQEAAPESTTVVATVSDNVAVTDTATDAVVEKQQATSEPSGQQTASGTLVEGSPPQLQSHIDHLMEKGLQPPLLPQNYIYRPELLDQLVQKVLSYIPDPSNSTVAVSITGANGFGKTTLAKALCHDPQIIKSFQDGFLLVELGPKAPNPVSNLKNLYLQLTGKRLQQEDMESLITEMRHTTQASFCNLLVILDGVWEVNDANPYISAFSNCSIVLTTHLCNITNGIPSQAELTVGPMKLDEAVALINGESATKSNSPVYALFSGLAEDLHHWPLPLCLVHRQIEWYKKRNQAPNDSTISTIRQKLQENGLTAVTDREQHKKAAVTACTAVSLDIAGSNISDKLMLYVLFTGVGCSLPTNVVHLLWQISDVYAEEVMQTLLSCGLVSIKTLPTNETVLAVHPVIAQHLLDGMNASQVVHLASYLGNNEISISTIVEEASSLTGASPAKGDVEFLQVTRNTIDYAELPCRLRNVNNVVIVSTMSLSTIIQNFEKQSLSLPECEEIKNKFQNTFNALVDECNEITTITAQSAVSLNTCVYNFIQANNFDGLIKTIEHFCRTNLIGEIASRFLNVLSQILSMCEDDLCDKVQATFQRIQTFESECNTVTVMEFAQIKALVELRKRVVGALTLGVDEQVSEVCQFIKSGGLAENLKRIKETYEAKQKDTQSD